MSKYTQVVDANWDDRILFPESIPHLFHYDLLYLWMLEKDQDRRSRTWRERLEGWRYLASLFLLGELQLEEESIREPFLAYTRPFGIERVSWLTAREGADRLGVLSPTVLVRPLPDFTGAALSRWRQTFGDLGRREPEIHHFVDLAVGRLLDGESRSVPSYRTRLAAVLERELGQAMLASQPAGRPVSIPVLRSLGWARPRLEAEGLALVDLLIREGGGDPRARVYVPRCTSCNELLTRTQEEPPIDVRGPLFEVICSRGHVNQLALADFLIWYRGSGQVVVWRDDRQVPLDRGAPPPRAIQGIEVAMEWNPGRVGGSRQRFLRLVFQDATVREHRLEEIFFDKVVVPGQLEGFQGLPIRLEWIDVLQNREVLPEVDPSVPRVIYRGLQLGGWPVPVPKVLGGLSLQVREDLALGIYPDPAKVGQDWKWFRAFLDGPGRYDHRLTCAGGEPVLPWVTEVKKGVPGLVVLEAGSDGRAGAIFPIKLAPQRSVELKQSKAQMGLDFGTSNTLLAFYEIDLGGGRGNPDTLLPERTLELVGWLGVPEAPAWNAAVGDFLPPRGYRKNAEDKHLIPSALWRLTDRQLRHLVRWNDQEPLRGATPLSNFKWDPPGGGYEEERRTYLREVLLLGLPVVLSELSHSRRITDLDIGTAFPLAFDHTAREGMDNMLESLGKELQDLSGLHYQFLSLNESASCVNAFGRFQQGETFLVADMGGGTMDVALFTVQKDEPTMHQIGSLRFAGEHCIQAIAVRKAGKRGAEEAAWRLRDLIAEGRARDTREPDARAAINRFVIIAFEFLRTMVAAHRRHHEMQKIQVVLVGNGWHLIEAFSERARRTGSQSSFSEFYRHLLAHLGEPQLELYEGRLLKDLPSSKHLLVRGALENTLEKQTQELRKVTLSRLPTGRTMLFEPKGRRPIRLGWEHLIGEDETVALQGASASDISADFIRFELDDFPPLNGSWLDELREVFKITTEKEIPYPDPAELRRAVGQSIDRNRIERGPLQVILEGRWREELSR